MRVLISQTKAIPVAGYGFIPRCIPWVVTENLTTGQTTYNLGNVSFSVKHAYPDNIDGSPTFHPTAGMLNDSPVPLLCIVILFNGEIDETLVMKEIASEADWDWLYTTYQVTKQELGITAVNGVEISQTGLNLSIGETVTLGGTVTPPNATDTRLTWEVSNIAIASIVPNGNTCSITALGEGSTTVTATSIDGGFTVNCEVTVV